jgi:hypothetical protein
MERFDEAMEVDEKIAFIDRLKCPKICRVKDYLPTP